MLFPTKRKQGSLKKYMSSSDASNTQDGLPCGTRKQECCGRPLRLCQKYTGGQFKVFSLDGKYDKYPIPDQ